MPKGSRKIRYQSERGALRNAIRRCTISACPQYNDYGGRNVNVCAEWSDRLTGFDKFLEHIGPKPSPDLTLERYDNLKGYEPGNVGWVTRAQNQANRRSSSTAPRDLGWGLGEWKTPTAGGKYRRGFSALIPLGDRVETVAVWSKETGLTRATIVQRIQRGWTPAQALDPDLQSPWGKKRIKDKKEKTPMEYSETNQPIDGTATATNIALQLMTERMNDMSRTIADLRSDIALIGQRMDEAGNMTSEEYGNQVVEQVMAAMPAIQAAAMKSTKRQTTRR